MKLTDVLKKVVMEQKWDTPKDNEKKKHCQCLKSDWIVTTKILCIRWIWHRRDLGVNLVFHLLDEDTFFIQVGMQQNIKDALASCSQYGSNYLHKAEFWWSNDMLHMLLRAAICCFCTQLGENKRIPTAGIYPRTRDLFRNSGMFPPKDHNLNRNWAPGKTKNNLPFVLQPPLPPHSLPQLGSWLHFFWPLPMEQWVNQHKLTTFKISHAYQNLIII